MLFFTTAILVILCQIRPYYALYVANGSPCSAVCNATTSGTYTTNLVCSTDDFDSTDKGQLLKSCIQCLSTSTYINSSYTDGNTDQFWELFHLKYVQQYCLTDKSTPHIAAVNACTSACTSLSPVLSTLWINSHPFLGQYDYCTENSSTYPQHAGDCAKCLQGQKESVYIGNFVDTMNQACSSRPYIANGNLIATTRALFATDGVSSATQSATGVSTSTGTATAGTVTSSAASATGTATGGSGVPSATAAGASGVATSTAAANSSGGLSTGAVAGIAVGATVIGIALIAGIGFLLWRRKKAPKPDSAESTYNLTHDSPSASSKDVKHGPPPLEKPATEFDGQVHEIPDRYDAGLVELPASPTHYSELPASSK